MGKDMNQREKVKNPLTHTNLCINSWLITNPGAGEGETSTSGKNRFFIFGFFLPQTRPTFFNGVPTSP